MTMQNGKSEIKKLIFSVLVFALPLVAGAVEVETSFSGGASYNSNLIDDDIRERIAAYNKKKSDAASSPFISADASLGLSWGSDESLVYFADYSLSSMLATAEPRFSRISQRITFSILNQLNNRYSVNLFLLLHQESRTAEKAAGENIDYGFFPIYGDGVAAAEIFYDSAAGYAWYSRIKGGYFKETHHDYAYLTGPELAAETGFYFYPSEDSSLKSGFGIDFFSFREIIIACPEGDMQLHNRYVTFFLPAEAKIKFGPLSLKGLAQYSLGFWLDSDVKENREKRRIEHLLQLQPEISYAFTKQLKLVASYSFRKNISSIGSTAEDYVDFSYNQHVAGLNLNYNH